MSDAVRRARVLLVWLLIGMPAPRAVMAAPFAYITSFGAGTVSVIDTAINQVVATIAVGDEPSAVAVHPSGTKVYVTNHDDATVWVIDALTNTVEKKIAGAGGFGIVASPDGQWVYAVNAGLYHDTVAVSVISTASESVVKRIPVGVRGTGDDVLDIVVSPDGSRLYMFTTLDTEQYPCYVDETSCVLTLRTIDTSAQALVSSVFFYSDIGQYLPAGIAFDPLDANRLYVATRNGYATMPIVSTTSVWTAFAGRVGGILSPWGIAADRLHRKVYVTDARDSLLVVDPVTTSLVGTVRVGNTPCCVAVNPDETRVYVVNGEDDTVSVVDTAIDQVVDTIPILAGQFIGSLGQFIGPPGVVLEPSPTPSATPASTWTGTPTKTPLACTADCDGDGTVEVHELVRAVAIALGIQPLSACPAAGCHARTCAPESAGCGAGVTIDCLVQGVRYALSGCPGS